MAERSDLKETSWPCLSMWRDDCGPQFAPPAGPRERRVLVQHARVFGTPNPGVPAIMSMAQAARCKDNNALGARESSVHTGADPFLAPTFSRRPYYGMTLASMARAAELRAHHNCDADAIGFPHRLAATNVTDESAQRMVKRRSWLPLDLSQVTDRDSHEVLDEHVDFKCCEGMQHDTESKLCQRFIFRQKLLWFYTTHR